MPKSGKLNIIFAGNDHALVIKNFLRYCGFTLEYERGLLTINTGSALFQGSRFSEQELTELFAQAFALPVGFKHCAWCEKLDCTQRCGACKQVYYCSRECQKAHWVVHKVHCNKTRESSNAHTL